MRFYEVICEEIQPQPICYTATFEIAEHFVKRYKAHLDDNCFVGNKGHSFEINHTDMAMTKENIDEEFEEL
jgi:hypothetical protein